MTHIANQRIKHDGKYYFAGEEITLSDEDVEGLPIGSVRANHIVQSGSEIVKTIDSTSDQSAALKAAVLKLKPEAFKLDGEIRSGALKHLNDTLKFDVSAADVAAARE